MVTSDGLFDQMYRLLARGMQKLRVCMPKFADSLIVTGVKEIIDMCGRTTGRAKSDIVGFEQYTSLALELQAIGCRYTCDTAADNGDIKILLILREGREALDFFLPYAFSCSVSKHNYVVYL